MTMLNSGAVRKRAKSSYSAPVLPTSADCHKHVVDRKKRTPIMSACTKIAVIATVTLYALYTLFRWSHYRRIDLISSPLIFAEKMGLIGSKPIETDYLSEYPSVKLLEDNYLVIKQEIDQLVRERNSKLPHVYELNKAMKFYHDPVEWQTLWLNMYGQIEENRFLAPKTMALLDQIQDLRDAMISVMKPHQKLTPHWGPFKLNMRYFLPLHVQNNNADQKCHIRVNQDYPPDLSMADETKWQVIKDGAIHYPKEGEGFMFDDTFLHESVNDYDEDRVVLFLDLARKLPWYLEIYSKFFHLVGRYIYAPHVKWCMIYKGDQPQLQ